MICWPAVQRATTVLRIPFLKTIITVCKNLNNALCTFAPFVHTITQPHTVTASSANQILHSVPNFLSEFPAYPYVNQIVTASVRCLRRPEVSLWVHCAEVSGHTRGIIWLRACTRKGISWEDSSDGNHTGTTGALCCRHILERAQYTGAHHVSLHRHRGIMHSDPLRLLEFIPVT